MDIYKKGEGKLTRRVAYYGILLLVVWGFKEFAKTLMGWFGFFRKTLVDVELPYYEQPLTIGVLLCIVLTVVVGWYLYGLINGRKLAPLLIDTETELKKVAWPSWDDAKQSTVIVLVFVAATAIFLTAVEFALRRVFEFILV